MKHEVAWNIDILKKFITYGNLSEEQKNIMRLRTGNHTDREIAHELHFSIPTYYRRVEELKKIYDRIQLEHPEMPKREAINERLFDFFTKENAIEFINHVDFDNFKIELKIIRKR